MIPAEQRLSVHLIANHGQDDGVPGGDRGVPPDPLREPLVGGDLDCSLASLGGGWPVMAVVSDLLCTRTDDQLAQALWHASPADIAGLDEILPGMSSTRPSRTLSPSCPGTD